MGEEGVVSYGPNSPQEIEGTRPEAMRDEEQDLRNMIHHGMEVYDGEQKKVGKISAVSEPLDAAGHFYITVERGFLGLGHDIYIPSQYPSVWNDQVAVEVSKGHIHTMGWEQPPDQETSPQSGPSETYAETASMAPRATQKTPEQRESNEQRIREGFDEPVIELGGGQEQPLEMNAAGETEAREEIDAGQTPPQLEAYATEPEAERIEGTGLANREQWEKAEERARGAAPDYTKYE